MRESIRGVVRRVITFRGQVLFFHFVSLHQIDCRTDECNTGNDAYPSRKLVVELHPVDIRAAIFFEKKHTNRSCVSDKVDGCDEKSHIPFNLEAGDKPFEE